MKVKKILIILIILIMLSFTVQINKVQAALQSNGDAAATKNRDTWFTQVRKMESLGGTLGLIETQNADLTSSSGSNNLDIHMQKNTEYGAMALLSASSYGNPNKIENGGTTTGNETGVVIPYNYEWTATHYTDAYNFSATVAFNKRYVNYYAAKNNERKIGDATIETNGWHQTTYVYVTNVLRDSKGDLALGLLRNNNDGIFGYYNKVGKRSYNAGGGYVGYSNDKIGAISVPHTSRAVIINGEGI